MRQTLSAVLLFATVNVTLGSCPTDHFQGDGGGIVDVNCGGDTIVHPFQMQEYEALFIGTIPKNTTSVQVNVTSDVRLEKATRKYHSPLTR